MKIIVTGGAGFLGSHLCQELLEANENNQVWCLDNLSTGNYENIKPLLTKYLESERFQFIRHDVVDPFPTCFWDDDSDQMIPDGIDQIYHLASPASPPKYQLDPIKTSLTNVVGTVNVLELARKVNEQREKNTKKNKTRDKNSKNTRPSCRVLLASTSEIYGDALEHPQRESYLGNVNTIGPRSCYDEGKRMAETLMFDYYRQHQVEIRVVRIFNTYGPKMNPTDGRVVSNFINQALKGEDITIYGHGTQTRSFCYVDDLIAGLMAMMNGSYQGPVNLGNPCEITVKELADLIIELIKEHSTTPSKLVTKPLPQDDPRVRCPDISLAQQILKWGPTVPLRDGLLRTIKHFGGHAVPRDPLAK